MVLVHAVRFEGLIASGIHWRSRVEIGRPGLTVALVKVQLVILKCERGNPPPLGTLEGRCAFQHLSRLVYESFDGQRLPAIRIGDGRVAGVGYDKLVIEWLVVQIDVIECFIGAILHSEGNDLFRNVVAEGSWGAESVVRRRQRWVVTVCREERIEPGLGSDHPRTVRIPVGEHPVGRIGNGFLPRGRDVKERQNVLRDAIEFDRIPPDRLAEKVGLGHVIIDGPGIVHGQGDVEEVAGMDGRPGEIHTDALQLGLNPFEGHVVFFFLCLSGLWQRRYEGQKQKGKLQGRKGIPDHILLRFCALSRRLLGLP